MVVGRVLIVPCIINPLLAILVVPFSIAMYITFGYLKNFATQMGRLAAISRSLILVYVKSTLDGLSTIRSANMEEQLSNELYQRSDYQIRPGLNRVGAHRWFGLRVDVICFVFFISAVFGSIYLKG